MSKKLKRVMCLVLALCLTMTLFLGTSEEVQASSFVKTFTKTLKLKPYQEVQINMKVEGANKKKGTKVITVLSTKDSGAYLQMWNGYSGIEMSSPEKKMKLRDRMTDGEVHTVVHSVTDKTVTCTLKVICNKKIIKYMSIEDHGSDDTAG